MSFDSPGWPDRPPALYAQAFGHQEKFNMVPLMLEPTTEPVWPQDEEEEDRRIKMSGSKVPNVASLSMGQAIVDKLRVELPDRLFAYMIKQPPSKSVPTKQYEYYLVYVSTTFAAAPGIIPRRLLLQLELKDVRNKPPRVPIAWELYPGTQVATELTSLGEFKIDLGEAVVKSIKAFFPAMPNVLTARTGGSIDIKKVQAKVQAAGRNSHKPEWRIADKIINYDFNPACVIQVPKGAQLAVTANLHVEARKRWIGGAIFRTYFRTAQSRLYVLGKIDGKLIDGDKLREGSKVTLRQPGVAYAEDRSKYSFVSEMDRPDNPGSTAIAWDWNNSIPEIVIEDEPSTLDKPTSDVPVDSPDVSGFATRHLVVPPRGWPALTGKYVKVRPGGLADTDSIAWLSADLVARMATGKGVLVVEADRHTIGMIEYDEDTSRIYDHGRINIYLASSRHNTNACVEAIRLVAQYMYEHLGHHRITSEPDLNDSFAITCYRKVGFRSIGRMRQYRRGMDDRYHDALLMELLTKELTISTVD